MQAEIKMNRFAENLFNPNCNIYSIIAKNLHFDCLKEVGNKLLPHKVVTIVKSNTVQEKSV